ncbi:phosphatase PAP2 family protein [Mesorhizobium sp. WSM4884]|uniref:acid phosphatase n=1 Tax=Mesorhizobium sp. WSM4884 TaxID=3038542 RepID=UPI0024168311|nr:phosphatase PAP2 family protein [Mesorhizobium sp. WSM4884]MDG4884888.1 phosphatase PAP2 family protein [Mesorhizobium sp. WSM4884]
MTAITRRTLMGAVAFAALALSQPTFAEEGHPYFGPETVNLLDLLVPPPTRDSAETKAELVEVKQLMASTSESRKQQAIADNEEGLQPFLAGTSIKVDAAAVPLTTALVQRILDTEEVVTESAKKGFARPRPPLVDEEIKPLIKLSKSGAYPSGHSTNSTAIAIVLSKMLPERKEELMQRANDYALSRLIVGVHYRSDLGAGHAAGALMAQALMQNPDFQKEFEPAKTELRKALGLSM